MAHFHLDASLYDEELLSGINFDLVLSLLQKDFVYVGSYRTSFLGISHELLCGSICILFYFSFNFCKTICYVVQCSGGLCPHSRKTL